jgi:hypothetical protein
MDFARCRAIGRTLVVQHRAIARNVRVDNVPIRDKVRGRIPVKVRGPTQAMRDVPVAVASVLRCSVPRLQRVQLRERDLKVHVRVVAEIARRVEAATMAKAATRKTIAATDRQV